MKTVMGSRVDYEASAQELRPARHLVGRFGYKASQPSVLYQIAIALNRDMGIPSFLFPTLDGESTPSPSGQRISPEDLELMRRYVSLLGVPARRDLSSNSALEGETLFSQIGCESCHQSSLTTDARHPLR